MALHCKFTGKFWCIFSKLIISFPTQLWLCTGTHTDSQEGKDMCTHPMPHHLHMPHIPHHTDGERHHTGQVCQQWEWDCVPKQGSCWGGLCLEELKCILPLEYQRFPWGSISLSCRAEVAGSYPRKAVLPLLRASAQSQPSPVLQQRIHRLHNLAQHSKAGMQENAKNPSKGDQTLAKKI